MSLISSLPLKKGDIVDIIAPASGCSKEEYENAIDFVGQFGLKPRYRQFEDLIKQGLCANTDEYRFNHLIESINSLESKAVWCLRGGYGSQRLLEKLDEIEPITQTKAFIGFSDITILLNYFADKWNWVCIHGPMPGQVGKINSDSWQHLSDILFGQEETVTISFSAVNNVAKEKRSVQGKILGGCLSLMQSLIGTAHMPNLEGSILLLEDDRFETPRRLDRIFNHLLRAGAFYDVEAVLLGNFLELPEYGEKEKEVLQDVINDLAHRLDEMGIPLIQNHKLGHAKDMLTIPIGIMAEIKPMGELEINLRSKKW